MSPRPGGLCQSAPLCGCRGGLPHQHAVCGPAVGADVPTGKDPGGVQRGPPPARHDPAGLCGPGAQYPLQTLTDDVYEGFRQLSLLFSSG